MADHIQPSILSLYGDEFFTALQGELKAEIPATIKYILSFFGHDCAIVLARFNGGSIDSIEGDLRALTDEMLLPGETMAQYLGRFVKCQSKFKFLDGQRKWFELITETCSRSVGSPHLPLASATNTHDHDSSTSANVENGNFEFAIA